MSSDRNLPRTPKAGRYSEEELDQARRQVDRAFALLGLVEGRNPQCPECGTSKKGKVALRNDKGYWKCHKCDSWGSPIKLLENSGYTFPDAVAALLGRPTFGKITPPEKLVLPEVQSGFRSTVDHEVYGRIVASGQVEEAVAYYGRWHIDPAAVRAAGATRITQMADLQHGLKAEFGRGRLVKAGVIKPAEETDTGVDVWLLNEQYPVVEPHRDPAGRTVGMQFRPNEKQLARIAAHKRGEGRYYPKFLSLRGAGPDGLVGCGLDIIANASGEPVYIVEGYKDMLAVMSMNAYAYAIPGAGANIPPIAIETLKSSPLIVALDEDEAGRAGSERVVKQLSEAGVEKVAVKTDMPQGMDATDVLVARHMRRGCSCTACETMRSSLERKAE